MSNKNYNQSFHLLVETAQVLPKHFVEYAVYYCSFPTFSFSLSWYLLQISDCTLHETDHMQDAVERYVTSDLWYTVSWQWIHFWEQ